LSRNAHAPSTGYTACQRLTNVARLTVEDIIEEDDQTFLKLGNDALLMPAPLGSFLKELPLRRQIGIAGKVQSSSWLFPGRQAGRHQHPDHLRVRLKRIGIRCNPSRNAALIQLGSEVPALVMADLLNLHPSTAFRWTAISGGNWTDYAGDRVRAMNATEGNAG